MTFYETYFRREVPQPGHYFCDKHTPTYLDVKLLSPRRTFCDEVDMARFCAFLKNSVIFFLFLSSWLNTAHSCTERLCLSCSRKSPPASISFSINMIFPLKLAACIGVASSEHRLKEVKLNIICDYQIRREATLVA